MRSYIEKSKSIRKYEDLIGPVMDILAAFSIVILLCGSLLTALGQKWTLCVYFSIASLIFDIILTYEAFALAFSGRKKLTFINIISSAGPLLAVSGPFLFGLIIPNFSSLAVKGFWLSSTPVSALTLASFLRLLRLTRLFPKLDSNTRIKISNFVFGTTFIVGTLVLALGLFAILSKIVPGYPMLVAENRKEDASHIALAINNKETQAYAKATGALKVFSKGQEIYSDGNTYIPADYTIITDGQTEVWFSVKEERKAQGTLETIFIISSIICAIFYSFASKRMGLFKIKEKRVYSPRKNRRIKDVPTSEAELKGILGR